MRDEEYVKNALAQMGELDTFGTYSEIKELPKILHDDEELLYITSGLMNGNTWLVAATSERVIFLDKGFFFGLTQVETPLEKINSIIYKTGLLWGDMKIYDGASYMIIKQCNKKTLKPFVDAVNMAKSWQKEGAKSSTNVLEDLERLAALKEKGVLSEEEFLAEKQKLMNKKKITVQDVAAQQNPPVQGKKTNLKKILIILGGLFLLTMLSMCSDEYKKDQAINEALSRRQPVETEKNILALREGLYLKLDQNDMMNFTACDTAENFSKYMKTSRGDTSVNYVKELVENGNCVFLNNSPKSEYFIKISALNNDRTRVSQIIREDFFGNEKEYAVDIVPSSKLLNEKKPSNPEYERYKKIVNQYNKDKKGKEISFDMERVFCKSRKIFNDGFLNDKMDAYERSGECLRIKSGTKLRYEEIGDDLIVGYTVLSGSYKGKKLYGFQ